MFRTSAQPGNRLLFCKNAGRLGAHASGFIQQQTWARDIFQHSHYSNCIEGFATQFGIFQFSMENIDTIT